MFLLLYSISTIKNKDMHLKGYNMTLSSPFCLTTKNDMKICELYKKCYIPKGRSNLFPPLFFQLKICIVKRPYVTLIKKFKINSIQKMESRDGAIFSRGVLTLDN